MDDLPEDPHYEAELVKALQEAKMKGLPETWTVKLDLVRTEWKITIESPFVVYDFYLPIRLL